MNSIIVMVILIPVIVFVVDYAILVLVADTDSKRNETDNSQERHDQ